jgi:hypothetical protein
MLLGGKPLNEPLVNYGQFVMNTQEQIQQYFQKCRSGNMGYLDSDSLTQSSQRWVHLFFLTGRGH